MKEAIKFHLIQYKFGRKLYKGTYYYIYNWLPMNCFWSDKLITSCGGRALKIETYEKTNL
jgi:hypothetical protein